MVASQTSSQRKKTKHPSRLAEVSEAEQWRQIHILPRSQTVRKVLARLKYSVPIYKARSGFSILTEEYLTFQTVSPITNPYRDATHISIVASTCIKPMGKRQLIRVNRYKESTQLPWATPPRPSEKCLFGSR